MSQAEEAEYFTTPIPMLNIALSGEFDGGLSKGVTMIAGKSKHFKTLFGLIMLKAWFDKQELEGNDDAVCVFYDTEDGASLDYFEAQGIDTERVIRKFVSSVEEMKMDIANVLESVTKEDKLCFFWDSLGNIASKKEYQDAVDGKDKADMTRAKQLKSLSRVVTIPLLTKDIPLIVIAHTYETQEMYSKTVVSGGTGPYYLANTIFVIGRQMEKDASKNLTGYNFIINIEKSRKVKEKSKFPITVLFDKNGVGGIDKWSGLLDVAVDLGYVKRPNTKTYVRACLENNSKVPDSYKDASKEYSKKTANGVDFWGPIIAYTNFKRDAGNHFKLVPSYDDEEPEG